LEERLLLMRLAERIDDRIEPHPFRPEDFHLPNRDLKFYDTRHRYAIGNRAC